jgi:hypothetical protein
MFEGELGLGISMERYGEMLTEHTECKFVGRSFRIEEEF